MLSTLDSVSKIVLFLQKNRANARQYLLFLDEFHSIVQYLYSSDTLALRRRGVFKDTQWLVRNTRKVIVADNTLSDHDFYFLDNALSEEGKPADLTFHINTFQTFEGVPVLHCSENETMIQLILYDFRVGDGCMVACNTKAKADYIYQRLMDATPDVQTQKRIRLYTSDVSSDVNIAREVQYWETCVIISSPKLRTGIDFHPKKPLNVYLFVCGDFIVCPAGAVQMSTRCRNIKALHIHTTKLRTKPRFKTKEAMNANLDAQLQCLKTVSCDHVTMTESATLSHLGDHVWSSEKLDDVYSENKFSRGYHDYLWYMNVMQASWKFNTDTYLEKRGCDVLPEHRCAQILLERIRKMDDELFPENANGGSDAVSLSANEEVSDELLLETKDTVGQIRHAQQTIQTMTVHDLQTWVETESVLDEMLCDQSIASEMDQDAAAQDKLTSESLSEYNFCKLVGTQSRSNMGTRISKAVWQMDANCTHSLSRQRDGS